MHGVHVFHNGMQNGMHGFPTECTDMALREASCPGYVAAVGGYPQESLKMPR